jgi:hypothetical protein
MYGVHELHRELMRSLVDAILVDHGQSQKQGYSHIAALWRLPD